MKIIVSLLGALYTLLVFGGAVSFFINGKTPDPKDSNLISLQLHDKPDLSEESKIVKIQEESLIFHLETCYFYFIEGKNQEELSIKGYLFKDDKSLSSLTIRKTKGYQIKCNPDKELDDFYKHLRQRESKPTYIPYWKSNPKPTPDEPKDFWDKEEKEEKKEEMKKEDNKTPKNNSKKSEKLFIG